MRFPASFGADIRDLIKNLLQVDITKRFGNMKNGVSDIKTHPFFEEMDWIALHKHQVALRVIVLICYPFLGIRVVSWALLQTLAFYP